MRIAYFGTRALGYHGLEALLDRGRHEVAIVFTKDYEITDGYSAGEFRSLCARYGIPIVVSDSVNNERTAAKLRDLGVDIGVSMYWRRLIKSPLIGVPAHGFINAHGSDLPKYRGFAATSWVILLGEDKGCVTIHRMTDGVADDGDILAKAYVPISEETTVGSLQSALWERAIELVADVLDGLAAGTLVAQPQDGSQAILAFPRLPRDGEIDWTQPASTIDRLIRAVTSPYPGAFTYWNRRKLFVWRAHVLENPPAYVGVPGHVVRLLDDGTAWVTTGDGILVLDEIQPKGEASGKLAQFIEGVQQRLGVPLTDEVTALWREIDELKERLK